MGSQYAEWSQYTTYGADDVVQYAGQIYVATAVNLNVVPYPPNATWTNISPVNPGILAGYVKNPMDSALQCYNPSTTINYSIDDAAYVSASEVRTDNINLIPGSLQNAIKVNDSIEMRTAQEIRAEQELQLRTTGAYGYKFHNVQAGSHPYMLGYDPATGNVIHQPYSPGGGGTLTAVGAGTGITVDNTVPTVPVVNNDGVLTVNTAKGALTVAAGTGINVGTVGTTITITNTSPSSGGTLTGVGAGTGVLVDNTVPAVPVVSNDGVLSVNTEKGALTVAAGSGISVATVAGTITITNDAPSSGGTLTGVGAGANISVDNTVPAVPVVALAVSSTVDFDGNDLTNAKDITATGAIEGLSLVAGASGITNNGTLETRDVGVVSIDGTAPATINMALTTTAVPPAILTMAYNPNGNDKLEVNKGMILDGGLVMGAGGATNNIENVLGLYSSEIVESKTLQAIDINTIGDGSMIYKTIDPLFADEDGTVMSITYPDPTAQNTVLYARGALSLNDPPNGGLPAQIIINGVPQTLNGSDWSSYAATQNVDMATFDIDNAGAIGATSVDTSDFITSATTITGLDVVATNSLSVDGLGVKQTLDFTATNELFVAKNGDDTLGNGSKLQPFATIQKAIDTADLTTPKTGLTVIQIANGDYNESIVIQGANAGWIQLNGSATSQNNTFGVVMRGSILIDLDAGVSDLISRQVIFSGLQLNAVISNGSTLEHTVGIQNCRFYPSAASNGVAILDTSTKNRVLIDNCEYTYDYPNTGVPFEFAGESTVSFTKCDIQCPNDANIITIGGTSYLQRLENCYIQNQFVSPTAPLLNITSTSTSTHSIALNIFSIASGTGITTPAIITANGGTLFVVSNNFNLAGTNPTTGNVIQYAGTAPTLIYGANTAVPLYASGIQSGITLVPLTDVGATAGKFSTLTATSGTIASTTMTGNTQTVVGTGQGVVAKTVSNGATVLNGRVNITGSASSIAMNVNTGSAATNVIELNGGSLSTNGATNIKITPTTIANAANNTAMTGVNSITMAGTTPSITGANNIGISNTNATTPLTITNSGDNPHIICNNAGASTTVPVEINLVNGALTLAYGNQGTDPRGAFFFFGGKDCIRIPSATQRVQMNYSPYSPTLAVSGAAGAWVAGTGAFTSGVPKLLGTQTITLSANNFPIIPGGFGTPFYLGVNGFINTVVLNAAHDFNITATYTRNRGGVLTPAVGQAALYGCAYPVSSRADGAFYSPVNGVSYNELVPAERITFTHGDILTLYIYGTYTGGSPPSITTPGTGLAAVFSPFLI